MGFFDSSKEQYEQVENGQHEAQFSHELAGGAAAFGAFKLWEKSQREKGEPVDHAFAKGALASFAGAAIDRLVETKGADAFDAYEAKQEAKKRVEEMYDQQYGDKEQWHPDHAPPAEFDI